jgi:hypothetical protein
MTMGFIYFLIFSVVLFLLSLVSYEKFRSTTLYALAIGGAVNANFFHAGNYPIVCFGISFGIDSIIYSLFAFCVILMYLKENKREAYILSFSSVIAIMFSACMQLVSNLLTVGSSVAVWKEFSNFAVSTIATVITIFIMLETINKLKQKNINQFVLLIIGMLIVSVVNSSIYYTAVTLINRVPENIWNLMLGSLIGKFIAILCSLGVLYLSTKIDAIILRRKQKNVIDSTDNNLD